MIVSENRIDEIITSGIHEELRKVIDESIVMVYQKICLSIDNRNSLINMKGIYWKGIKQRIGRFLDKVYDCILIFTDWLG